MTDKQIELLPCPFCGGEAEEPFETDDETREEYNELHDRELGVLWMVYCTSAHHNAEVYGENAKNAIKAWNARHNPELALLQSMPEDRIERGASAIRREQELGGFDGYLMAKAAITEYLKEDK